MRQILYLIFIALIFFIQCADSSEDKNTGEINTLAEFYNHSGMDAILSGGVKMILINTPKGNFNVWTKRIGNNPRIKVLLLHGGPAATHEYLECFDSYFPKEGIEYYYYDQLGSFYSDQPADTSLWNIDRFVDEVEQVRKSLNLDKNNFYLYGHSWGGMLAIEYALKYQENLKGLIISNMMSSIPDYIKYAEEVLGPQLNPDVLKEIKELEAIEDYSNPRYMELITTHYYPEHILRMPLEEWPDPVHRGFKNINLEIYIPLQGPSEFGVAGNAKLKNWDRKNDLEKISVPALVIGAKYDTMNPEHMQWIASQVQQGRYLYCPNGSHLSLYDDQKIYFDGIVKFVKDVDTGNFNE
jgi:proline iminopeptidase